MLTEMFNTRYDEPTFEMSLEKLFVPRSAPAALGTRARARARVLVSS